MLVTQLIVPVGDTLEDIGVNSRKVVVHLECEYDASSLKSLGDVRTTKIVEQLLGWLTRSDPKEYTPNIYWIILIFLGIKKYDGRPDRYIKSWAQPVCWWFFLRLHHFMK